jgi:hypothetical protein
LANIRLVNQCYILTNTPAYFMLLEVTTVKCLTVEACADQIVKECYILTTTPAYFMLLEVSTVKCLTVDASADQKTRNLIERNRWQILVK